MKTKKSLALIMIVSVAVIRADYSEEKSHFSQYKADFVEVVHRADQQREWLHALLENKEVDLKELSLDQLSATTKKLESYKEKLLSQKHKYGRLSEQESRCLELAQELVRQLNNARLAYDAKVENTQAVKKIAISAGAAVAVFGGLMLLNVLTPLDISWSTALLCGVATGCVVGVITHYDTLLQQVQSVSSMVNNAGVTTSFNLGIKTIAAIGGAAVVSGVALWQKDSILEFLHLRKPGKSLSEMARSAGIIEKKRA